MNLLDRPTRVRAALLLTATIVVAVSLQQTLMRLDVCFSTPCGPIIATFVVAIFIGERLRVELPGRGATAPLATASAFAFAMAQPPTMQPLAEPHPYGASIVIAFTAVTMALGALPEFVRRRPVHLTDPTIRLISVAVVALLFRELPLDRGRAPMVMVREDPTNGRQAALLMIAVSLAGLVVLLLLTATVDAARAHAPLGRSILDTARAMSGITAALSATASLIALDYQPLSFFAVPLLLLPLALTQFGLRRYAGIRATYRQTIIALSRLTEVSGNTAPGHPERVAALSVSMGRELGMSDRGITDLEYAALLHDIGQVGLLDPIPRGATVMAAPADQRRIAEAGAHIVRETGVLDQVATILETQTTPFRQTRELGESLPLGGRIIKVSNAYDDLATSGPGTPQQRAAALERIHLGLGYEYDPRVVDILSRVLERDVAAREAREARPQPVSSGSRSTRGSDSSTK